MYKNVGEIKLKEIEVLVELYDDINIVKEKLKKFKYKGTKTVIDEYYYDPKRDNLKPDRNNKIYNCLRLREKEGVYTITFKDDIYENEKWIYSNEHETKIESINAMRQIFKNLGLIKFIDINNIKETYEFGQFEIVLENVKDLGAFLEVEYCTDEDVNVKGIKEKIYKFIEDLGINVSEELNMGKPEMYLKKHGITLK